MQNPVKSVGLMSELLNNVRVAWKLFHDPRVSKLTKFALPGLAAAYFLLPIDLLPDFLLGFGQLDDLALMALGLKLFIDMSPKWLVQFYRDQVAGKNPSDPAGPSDRSKTVDGNYRVME